MSTGRFFEAALREAEAAADWYEDEQEDLGSDFMVALMERVRRAVAVPGAGRVEPRAPARFELRWYKLKRFPYWVLMGTVDGQRMVVAVAHERRRPGYWRRRLGKR